MKADQTRTREIGARLGDNAMDELTGGQRQSVLALVNDLFFILKNW